MSVLGRIIGAASASLSAHGVPEPGPGRFEQLLEDGERLFVLEAVYEGYLMHYGTPRACAGAVPASGGPGARQVLAGRLPAPR